MKKFNAGKILKLIVVIVIVVIIVYIIISMLTKIGAKPGFEQPDPYVPFEPCSKETLKRLPQIKESFRYRDYCVFYSVDITGGSDNLYWYATNPARTDAYKNLGPFPTSDRAKAKIDRILDIVDTTTYTPATTREYTTATSSGPTDGIIEEMILDSKISKDALEGDILSVKAI